MIWACFARFSDLVRTAQVIVVAAARGRLREARNSNEKMYKRRVKVLNKIFGLIVVSGMSQPRVCLNKKYAGTGVVADWRIAWGKCVQLDPHKRAIMVASG